jgi:hypothetical protein
MKLLTAGKEPEILSPMPPLDNAVYLLETALSASNNVATLRRLISVSLQSLYTIRYRRENAKTQEDNFRYAVSVDDVDVDACRYRSIGEGYSESGGFLRRQFKGRKTAQPGQSTTARTLSAV